MIGTQFEKEIENQVKVPSSSQSTYKAINFSDRNTALSESDINLNSSQALMNEGFKKKAILEWEISPIKQQSVYQECQKKDLNHRIEDKKQNNLNTNINNIPQSKQNFDQNPHPDKQITNHNLENNPKQQLTKMNNFQIQNKILSKILKKSTTNHINQLNQQYKSQMGKSMATQDLNQQQVIKCQQTENQLINQESQRQRVNTQDIFYFAKTGIKKNTLLKENDCNKQEPYKQFNTFKQNNLQSKQSIEQESSHQIYYLPLQNLISNSMNFNQLIKDNIESQQTHTINNKISQKSSISFNNLLNKIQINVEQSLYSKNNTHRQSINPQQSTKMILSDRNTQYNEQNIQDQQKRYQMLPLTTRASKQNEQNQLNEDREIKNFIKNKNSINIPLQKLTKKQMLKNSQYLFPLETDKDSTPFQIPKNQFQYHYRDNSYQLIQNNQENPNQIASTQQQENNNKAQESERGTGRQRANAYSSLAGNLDEIYKKLQGMKGVQNIECH